MKLKRNIVGIIAILPSISGATEIVNIIHPGSRIEVTETVVRPGGVFKLGIDGVDVELSHDSIGKLFDAFKKQNVKNEPIEVKIHEEARLVDFSSLNGITVRIPFEQINQSVPNGRSVRQENGK